MFYSVLRVIMSPSSPEASNSSHSAQHAPRHMHGIPLPALHAPDQRPQSLLFLQYMPLATVSGAYDDQALGCGGHQTLWVKGRRNGQRVSRWSWRCSVDQGRECVEGLTAIV